MTLASEIKLIFAGTKTFLAKAEAEFVKLFGKAPSVLQAASTFVTFATPMVIGVEALLAPEAEPETLVILGAIKTDLAALGAAAQSEATASTAGQALTNLQTNLPALLAVGEVKNPATVSKITEAVTAIGGELNAFAAAFKSWLASLNPASAT